jgi:hypothetical protein
MIFDIFYVDGIFHTRLKSEPDPLSLESYYKSLTSHSEWSIFSKVLSDETAIDYGLIKFADMMEFVTIGISFKNKIKKSSFAIYVNSNLNFGMARVWKAFIDTEWDANVGVFRSYENARSWLKKYKYFTQMQ